MMHRVNVCVDEQMACFVNGILDMANRRDDMAGVRTEKCRFVLVCNGQASVQAAKRILENTFGNIGYTIENYD